MPFKYASLICYLILVLCFCGVIVAEMLNSSVTPFSAGTRYVPYNTGFVPKLLPRASFSLSGPNKELSPDLRADAFLVPNTDFAKVVVELFAQRVQI